MLGDVLDMYRGSAAALAKPGRVSTHWVPAGGGGSSVIPREDAPDMSAAGWNTTYGDINAQNGYFGDPTTPVSNWEVFRYTWTSSVNDHFMTVDGVNIRGEGLADIFVTDQQTWQDYATAGTLVETRTRYNSVLGGDEYSENFAFYQGTDVANANPYYDVVEGQGTRPVPVPAFPVAQPAWATRAQTSEAGRSVHESTERGYGSTGAFPAFVMPPEAVPFPMGPLPAPGVVDLPAGASPSIIIEQFGHSTRAENARVGAHVRAAVNAMFEKEAKFQVQQIPFVRAALGAFGEATEVGDLVAVMYDNLPGNRKAGWFYSKDKHRWMRRDGAQERAQKVWKYFSEIDHKKALADYVVNQLQDAAIGSTNRVVNKAAKPVYDKFRTPVGINWRAWGAFG